MKHIEKVKHYLIYNSRLEGLKKGEAVVATSGHWQLLKLILRRNKIFRDPFDSKSS